VALEHHSAVNFVHWSIQEFTPQQLAGVLFSTSVCFDLSVFEMFVTLSAGGKNHTCSQRAPSSRLPERMK